MRTEGFSPENGARPTSKKLGIVITDGKSIVDSDKTIPYAEEVKEDGITLLAVGVGPEIDEVELRGIASDENSVWNVDEYRALDGIRDTIVQQLCPEIPPEIEGNSHIIVYIRSIFQELILTHIDRKQFYFRIISKNDIRMT